MHISSVTVLAAQIQDAPTTLLNNVVATTAIQDNQIGLTWSAPSFNCGSSVIDYRLWSDQATGSTLTEIEAFTSLNYMVTSFTRGLIYRFKMVARNAYRNTVLSNTVSILQA